MMDVRWSGHGYDNKDNQSIIHSFTPLLSLFASMAQENNGMQNAGDDLLNAFRAQYQHFSVAIPGVIQSNIPVDPVSLARLGDDLDEYCNLAQEVRHVI